MQYHDYFEYHYSDGLVIKRNEYREYFEEVPFEEACDTLLMEALRSVHGGGFDLPEDPCKSARECFLEYFDC